MNTGYVTGPWSFAQCWGALHRDPSIIDDVMKSLEEIPEPPPPKTVGSLLAYDLVVDDARNTDISDTLKILRYAP